MKEKDFEKRLDIIEKQIEKFNSANNILKRFKIFNTFYFELESLDNYKVAINIINEEGGAFENTMTLLNSSDENFIVIDIFDEHEFLWLVKAIDRFTIRTEELTSKARELAKPQVGILIYDEYTDTYVLNSITGKVLLQSKSILKQISGVKIDLTNILFNLRKGLTIQEFGKDIFTQKASEILEKCVDTIKHISISSNRIKNFERIPRLEIDYRITDSELLIRSQISDIFDEYDKNGSIVNKKEFKYDIHNSDDLANAYNILKTGQLLNDSMKRLARILQDRKEPVLYSQDNEYGKWILTKEGREALNDLRIINFINDDFSSIEFNIE